MRVLVTGGAGYIGSVAVEKLLAAGHDVTVLDNLWRGHPKSVSPQAKLVRADLQDADGLCKALTETAPEAVMHFAAATLVGESVAQPGRYFATNVTGGINLLNAMHEASVNVLVFSSTAAVYGMPDQIPIPEDAPKAPINPYGLSKLMVEQMLPWHAGAWGLRYACLRYFNVAGATEEHGEDHDPETHLIPVALLAAMGRRDPLQVFGTDYDTPDGTAIRDYVHVEDLVDAHLLALDRLCQANAEPLGAFNLGTRDGFSVREVIAAVERVTGLDVPRVESPRRPGDPPVLIADSTRAREVLGWNPTRSTLDQMIGSAYRWMRAHPRGYE